MLLDISQIYIKLAGKNYSFGYFYAWYNIQYKTEGGRCWYCLYLKIKLYNLFRILI